jgi:hypothetical protein
LEAKRKDRAKIRRWLGGGCAVALLCACASPRAALGQESAAGSTTGGSTKSAAPKSKTTNSKTAGSGTASAKAANPQKHVGAAGKSTRASSSSTAKAHAASHPAANTHPKSNTAASAHNSKSKYAAARKGGKKKTARGQQKIDPERAQAIQEALIRDHYMSGEAAGTWNQASEDAMRRYQADHGWQSKTVPDSRALISLGLGPSHDRLLNPESAMTTEPAAPHAESLTPVSHSADPGTRMNTTPVAPATAAHPQHDSSGPQ